MRRLLAHLVRLLTILIGYMAAVVAAGFFYSILDFAYTGQPIELSAGLDAFFVTVLFVATLVTGYFSFLPAAAFIAAAELMRWRSFLAHTLAGGAISLISLGLLHILAGESFFGRHTAMILASGLVAGIVYWAVAGRDSGRWLETTAPGPSGS